MADLRKILGFRLRALREAQGKSQAQLAEAADLTPNMISRYENGQKFPTYPTLEALAAALKVTPPELFGLIDADEPEARTEALADLHAALAGKDAEVIALLTHLARRLPARLEPEK